MTRVDIIAGARPNFMKIGPIIHAIQKHNDTAKERIEYRLIHTGQHYDKKMSEDFFTQLNIPKPNINLGVGSDTAAIQTANIMMRYEAAVKEWKPELCIVGDEMMPEEINRMVTDSITDYFFTTTALANHNLKELGHGEEKIFFVGNTMIDSLLGNLDRLIQPSLWNEHNLSEKDYLVMTLHRPSNVDGYENLRQLLSLINDNVGDKKVVFPMHPRTKKMFDQLGIAFDKLIITGPMSYLEFIYMVKYSAGVVTDSGGITEETTVLNVPCLTLRNSTERPETVTIGTNEIVGTDLNNIVPYLKKLVAGKWKSGSIPDLWDGKTADRIVEIISKL